MKNADIENLRVISEEDVPAGERQRWETVIAQIKKLKPQQVYVLGIVGSSAKRVRGSLHKAAKRHKFRITVSQQGSRLNIRKVS